MPAISRATAAVLCGFALFVPSGCERQTEAVPPPPPEVTVAHPIQQDVTVYYEFTGTTEAIASVEIRARVEGYLQRVEMKDADDVEPGDMLFVIDPAEYQAALDRAEAELARNQAELQSATLGVERLEGLIAQGAVNRKELDDAYTAQAMGEAEVAAAKAAVTKAKLDLDYTQVRSPIAGRVSRSLVDAGNLVGAGERTLLTTVVQMDPMYVYFSIPERILLKRLAARPADQRRHVEFAFYVGLANEKGYPHEGILDYVDNTVDSGTGTIRVRGQVPNDEGLLFPGAFVRIRVPGQVNANAVLVREEAIGTDLGGKYVLVVDAEDVVHHRPVELGATEEGWRVVREGLSPDERYIVSGLQRARPGLPVTVKRAEQPLPEPPPTGTTAATSRPSEPASDD